MNESNSDLDEILKAFTMLEEIKEEPVEYRLHYNEQGDITMTSMRSHPESERYVIVDEDTFKNYYRYRIIDKKPQLIPHDLGNLVKLRKSTTGFKVVKNHAALLVEDHETIEEIEYYENRVS